VSVLVETDLPQVRAFDSWQRRGRMLLDFDAEEVSLRNQNSNGIRKYDFDLKLR